MADCEEIKFYSPQDIIGGPVKEPVCTPDDRKVPEDLREPVDSYVSTDKYALPSIRVFNVRKSADCYSQKGHPTGDPGKTEFIVPQDLLHKDINIHVVADISTQVIKYIIDNDLLMTIQQQFYSRDCTPDWLSMMTGMTVDQATRLIHIVERELEKLDIQAQTIADANIECYFINNKQGAFCDEELGIASAVELFGPEFTEQLIIDHFQELDEQGHRKHPYSNLLGGVMYYIVPNGLIKSKVSLLEADRIAFEVASAAVVCLFVNERRELDCRDENRPDKPIGGGDDFVPTPSDQEWNQWLDEHLAHSFKLVKPVGTVVIPEGTIVSHKSLADANDKADQLGWSRLVCYYINDDVKVECDDPLARGYKIIPDAEHPPVQADIVKRITGLKAVVPAGFITSIMSIDDANETAYNLASSLLQCCFTNDEIIVECAPIPIKDKDGTIIRYVSALKEDLPGRPKVVYSVKAPAGLFFLCQANGQTAQLIKDTLNLQARLWAEARLVCYYCNDIVLPTCVPTWVIEAVTTGIVLTVPIPDLELDVGDVYMLDLPLEPEDIYNPYSGEKEDLSKWSKFATAGVPSDMICALNYQPTAVIGEGVNLRVVQSGEECPYANDLVIAACLAPDPYPEHPGRTDTGDPYIFYSLHTDDCISPVYSNPTINEYVEVPAGSFLFTESDVPGIPSKDDPSYDPDKAAEMVKQAANDAALAMAKAMLYCVYANPVTYVTCDTDNGFVNILCGDQWWFSQNLNDQFGDRKLLEGSPIYDNPIVIPYGTFLSMISMLDVYNSVRVYAESLVFCFYGNLALWCDCEEKGADGEQFGGGYVPDNTIIDTDPNEADKKAKKLACATVACIDLEIMVGPEGPEGPEGPPGPAGPKGPQGPPGECQGMCLGIYT